MRQINRSKYNVDKDKEKRTYNGMVFDSVIEMKMFRDFILPKVESGEIVTCDMQVKFELQEKFKRGGRNVLPINYIADFVVVDNKGHTIVYDCKGCPDSVALLKRKLFWHKYPDIDYQWISYCVADGGWVDYEIVKRGRKERNKKKSTTKSED